MAGGRTALLVVVAEAEPAVARLRLQLDPVARLDVPAHVTVLFPFMPASEIRENMMPWLAALFGTVPAFTHNFTRTAWFGDEVLWLASDADQVFRSLTELVWTAFPAYPPFGGQFDDVVAPSPRRGSTDAQKLVHSSPRFSCQGRAVRGS